VDSTLDATVDGAAAAIDTAMDDDLGDELLGLIFTACHPILSSEARVALTLKVVGGRRGGLRRGAQCQRTAIQQRVAAVRRLLPASVLEALGDRDERRLLVLVGRIWAAGRKVGYRAGLRARRREDRDAARQRTCA